MSKKGSLPMMSLRDMRVQSTHSKRSSYDTKIVPANPENSTFQRNVLQMKADFAKTIEHISVSSLFESHCFNVLSHYEAGENHHWHLTYSFNFFISLSLECNLAHNSLFGKQPSLSIMVVVVEFWSLGVFLVNLGRWGYLNKVLSFLVYISGFEDMLYQSPLCF